MNRRFYLHRFFAYIACALYLASLFLPVIPAIPVSSINAVYTPPTYGVQFLFSGWMAFFNFSGVLAYKGNPAYIIWYVWYANIFGFIAFSQVLNKKDPTKEATIFWALLALCISASYHFYVGEKYVAGIIFRDFVVKLTPAYYCWLASTAMLFIASLVRHMDIWVEGEASLNIQKAFRKKGSVSKSIKTLQVQMLNWFSDFVKKGNEIKFQFSFFHWTVIVIFLVFLVFYLWISDVLAIFTYSLFNK